MKLKTRLSLFLIVGVGAAALSTPAWRSESGKPTVKPTSTADRKTVTFAIDFSPHSDDFGPQVVGYEWSVGSAHGSGVISKPGAVVDTRRGRRGELVNFEAWGKLNRNSSMAAKYLDAEAFYGGQPFGPNCSVDPHIAHCTITAHVPAVD